MQVSLISPSFNAYVRAPVRIAWRVLPALGQAETANVADADGDAGELPGGAVNVYINGVLVTSSAEMSQDYVLAADLPEAPTRNDISVVLLHRDSQREVDRVSSIFWLGDALLDAEIEEHVSRRTQREAEQHQLVRSGPRAWRLAIVVVCPAHASSHRGTAAGGWRAAMAANRRAALRHRVWFLSTCSDVEGGGGGAGGGDGVAAWDRLDDVLPPAVSSARVHGAGRGDGQEELACKILHLLGLLDRADDSGALPGTGCKGLGWGIASDERQGGGGVEGVLVVEGPVLVDVRLFGCMVLGADWDSECSAVLGVYGAGARGGGRRKDGGDLADDESVVVGGDASVLISKRMSFMAAGGPHECAGAGSTAGLGERGVGGGRGQGGAGAGPGRIRMRLLTNDRSVCSHAGARVSGLSNMRADSREVALHVRVYVYVLIHIHMDPHLLHRVPAGLESLHLLHVRVHVYVYGLPVRVYVYVHTHTHRPSYASQGTSGT